MGVSSFKSGFTKVNAVPAATVTATTGSPTVDTSSRAGKTIYKFTGSGTITIGTAGTCEYLVIGGGSNNGAGGYIYNTSAILPSGTLTVTIGAGAGGGGVGTVGGNHSRLGDIVALGGGIQDFTSSSGTYSVPGGTGGGSNTTAVTRSAALSGAQGYNGGQGITGNMGPSGIGGGGGAGSVGGNAVSAAVGGAGGTGATNSITGTSTTYAAGGGGFGTSTYGSGAASVANTGNGGTATTGNSGFVVVVIG